MRLPDYLHPIRSQLLFVVLLPCLALGQEKIEPQYNRILEKYEDYFSENRETVHLHLNKTKYAVGEHIWFTAYLFDQELNEISLETTYIYVDLYNKAGEKIESRTIYYERGSGSGDIELKDGLASGEYFLQAYTHKMNLFKEDDSSLYPIDIINLSSNLITAPNAINSELDIQLTPEGGKLVADVFTSCVLRIRDLQDNPVRPDSVLLTTVDLDDQKIEINELGLGRFSILPQKNSSASISIYYRGKVHDVSLPPVERRGFNLDLDLDYNKMQLLLGVNTNSATAYATEQKELTLLIHKDGQYQHFPLRFSTQLLTREIALPLDELPTGVNAISLLDSQGKLLAERLFFNPEQTDLEYRVINMKSELDSITLYLQAKQVADTSAFNQASLTVLPPGSVGKNDRAQMYSRFYLGNYLAYNDIINLQKSNYPKEKSALYNLDALLLVKGNGRYAWRDIIFNKPANSRTAYNTVDLSGYANIFDAKSEGLQLVLYSVDNRVFEAIDLDKDLGFEFKNLSLAKDSKFSLTITNKKGKPIYANFFCTIRPSAQKFRHVFSGFASQGLVVVQEDAEELPDLFKEAEQLDEVILEANKLKRAEFFGKYNGRKITKEDYGKVTLKNFLSTYGYRLKLIDTDFYDPRRAGSWQLYRSCPGFVPPPVLFPSISFDGDFTRYIMIYADVRMEYIDEIYFLRNANCDPGFFVVYTNEKYKNRTVPEDRKTTKEFIVDIGHDNPLPFKRPLYYSLESPMYSRYGIVSWIPRSSSNEQGVHTVKIPNDQAGDDLLINLEGFNSNGKLLFDTISVQLD